MLKNPAPNLRLPGAGVAGEERTAVEHDAQATAARTVLPDRPHLRDEVQQEQHRAVRDARQTGAEAAAEALLGVLGLDHLGDLLPLHAEGRVRQHVVELLAGEGVVGERVAEVDMLGVLPLDEHVRLADGVGLVVELLAEERQLAGGVHLGQGIGGYRQHPAGAGGGVVQRTHRARLGERLVVAGEENVDHEADDLARGEVLPGGLVGGFREAPDELLEDQSHRFVGDLVRVQVHCGELLHQHEQQVLLVEFAHPLEELEALEDIAGVGREVAEVGDQVLADMLLVGEQARQGEAADVVEGLLALATQEDVDVHAFLGPLRVLRDHRVLGRLEDAVQPPQEGEGEDDLAVVGLLVVTPEKVGDGPEEGGEFLEAHESLWLGGKAVLCQAKTVTANISRGKQTVLPRDLSGAPQSKCLIDCRNSSEVAMATSG